MTDHSYVADKQEPGRCWLCGYEEGHANHVVPDLHAACRAEVAALRRALYCYRRDHEFTRRSRTCACECCVAALAALATRGGDTHALESDTA